MGPRLTWSDRVGISKRAVSAPREGEEKGNTQKGPRRDQGQKEVLSSQGQEPPSLWVLPRPEHLPFLPQVTSPRNPGVAPAVQGVAAQTGSCPAGLGGRLGDNCFPRSAVLSLTQGLLFALTDL